MEELSSVFPGLEECFLLAAPLYEVGRYTKNKIIVELAAFNVKIAKNQRNCKP